MCFSPPQPCKGIPSGVKTYATITRKLDRLPKDSSSPNYLGLEVNIDRMYCLDYISFQEHVNTIHEILME